MATFKDDGYSAFEEITRDGFGELIAAIEGGAVDVVIVRDIDRLTRNLTDWNAFEKACVRHGVRLSAYTGGDLDLSTAEGAYYGGMETLRARRESAVKSMRVREAQDREARKGRRAGGGQRWFGYTRIYANPDEPNHKKRHIVREEINPVEADLIREAAWPLLEEGDRERRAFSASAWRMSARSSTLIATVTGRSSAGWVVWYHAFPVVTVRDRPSRPDVRVCGPTCADARETDERTSVTVRGHRGGTAARQWQRMV